MTWVTPVHGPDKFLVNNLSCTSTVGFWALGRRKWVCVKSFVQRVSRRSDDVSFPRHLEPTRMRWKNDQVCTTRLKTNKATIVQMKTGGQVSVGSISNGKDTLVELRAA